MGYRIYLASLSKKRLKYIKNVSSDKELFEKLFPEKYIELQNKIDINEENEYYVGVYDICEQNLHEFGKYISWTEKFKQKSIFKNKEFNNDKTQEHDLFIIDKKGLEFIIKELNQELLDYYSLLFSLSKMQKVLLSRKIDDENKKIWASACNTIFNDKNYNPYQYDYLKLNSTLEDLFNDSESNNKIINEAIIDISNKFNEYFSFQLFEYSEKRTPFYNLNENEHSINNSWYKDKVILELVHIYKTFDFKKNVMVIYGY